MIAKLSREAVELWNEYAQEFEERWGIDREVSAIIGARSKKLFAAEFKEFGIKSYRNSVVLPIRNAMYSAFVAESRWRVLQSMKLIEPILDYGCGVGYQLLWLKRHGFKLLYAYEMPGIQHKVLVSMMGKNDIPVIRWFNRLDLKINTILCTNVLEHVTEPVKLLRKLLNICPNVIANICTDHDAPHVASHAELDKCRVILEQQETLYRAA